MKTVKPTKVADGLGMLARPGRKKLSDAGVKKRIGDMLALLDDATKANKDDDAGLPPPRHPPQTF